MLSDQIAKFVCSTEYGDLPKLAIENAKRTMLDCIGVTLAASQDPYTLMVKDLICEMGGREESTIFGDGRKVPSVNAALVNGVASHALDFDDTSQVMLGHPSVISCPPVFAVGEKEGSTGKEILLAYILGGEVACRLGAALTAKHYELGWHNTGTVGTFGATVSAGKLLELDEGQLTNAIGIAASMASGLKKNFGTACKPYHAGQASSNGARAAVLAKKGFDSAKDIFEGTTGFIQLFSGSFQEDKIDMMGRPFVIADPGYTIKLYPSCAFTHSSIDCVLKLREEYKFSPGDVAKVESGCSQSAVDTVTYVFPENGLQGKFSMPFCLALSILDGKVSLEQFTMEKCHDPTMLELMRKVKFFCDPEINLRGYSSFGCRLKITLCDGRELKAQAANPRGDPAYSISDETIKSKFSSCASFSIDQDKQERLVSSILGLERIQQISDTTGLMSSDKVS